MTHQPKPDSCADRGSPSALESGPSLCDRCEERASCGWAAASRRSRQFCEVMPEPEVPAFLGRTAPVQEAPLAAVEGPRGLCSNCGNAATCRFPRPAGGVFHCEEYC
ncbi:MAG: hypothetical protein GX442_00665 [Candidatus Riflebacteria bacterium]|nr:hypothetical protein [Candidatus Riflebacteria bacterium]